MSAWSTALARSPSAAAAWLASISRSTSSGPTRATAEIQAIARPRDGEAEAAALAARRRGAAPAPAGRSGRRPATPPARKKIAPSAAISQNQSIAAPTAKASDGGEQRPRSSSRCGPRAARQAAKPVQSREPTSARTSRPPTSPELGEGLQVERVGVVDRQVDRAQLVPGELVGAGAVAEQRLFLEGVDRDPAEVVAAGAGELGEVLLRAGSGTATSELENWSQARPPTAIATPIASTRERPAATAFSTVGLRESSTARPVRPPSAPLEPPQPGEERQRQRRSRRAGSAAP